MQMKRHDLFRAVLGMVAIFILAVVIVNLNRMKLRKDHDNYNELIAMVDTAEGLFEGDKVLLSGVQIGKVIEIKLNKNYQAEIHLLVRKDIQIPEDSTAIILTDGILGDKYVSILAGGSEDYLEDGDEFEYTKGSADINMLAGQVIQGIKK